MVLLKTSPERKAITMSKRRMAESGKQSEETAVEQGNGEQRPARTRVPSVYLILRREEGQTRVVGFFASHRSACKEWTAQNLSGQHEDGSVYVMIKGKKVEPKIVETVPKQQADSLLF